MRTLKVLVILLAVCGVVALIVASRATPRPLVSSASVSPSMNFAYVRISGVVPDYPTLSTTEGSEGYLSFNVQDTDGQVRVAAYRSTVDTLLAQHSIPMPGDVVTIEGSLRVRDDDVTLTLDAPDALTLQFVDTKSVELSALDAMPIGTRAAITAQVRDVRDLSPVLRRVILRHGDTLAQMILPLGLVQVFGAIPALQAGDWVFVAGGVSDYRGQRQMLPACADDIQPVTPPALETLPVHDLTRKMAGRWVAVHGTVSKLQPVKGGELLDLQDAQGGTITVAMFDPWFGVPFSQTLATGDTLTAQGELIVYMNKLEVQPELSVDLILDP